MPYVDRTTVPIIKVRCSADDGRTWPEESELVVYESPSGPQTAAKSSMQDAWSEMGRFSVGLPNLCPLPEGGALLVYYAGPQTDVTGIHWALLQ